MLKLAVAVVAIALPDCINPSLIGGELLLATGPHPRRRTAMFTLAAGIVTFVFGVAFALGLGDLILALLPKPGPTVKYALIAAAGVVLMIGGTVVWLRRRALVSDDPREGTADRLRVLGTVRRVDRGLRAPDGVSLLRRDRDDRRLRRVESREGGAAGALLRRLHAPADRDRRDLRGDGKRAEDILRPVGDWLFLNWPIVVGPLTAVLGFGVLVYGIVQLA